MLEGIGRAHLIGIGGIGVSGVARGLLALGVRVSGSDVRESQLTEALAREGAEITIGHDARLIDGADLVVYSTAVPDTNPELALARERGVPVLHRAEVLGAILARYPRAVGVIGTHGKGTVSSGIAWLLEQAGQDPAFIIGGMLHDFDRLNARLNDGPTIVAEVDESDGSLRHVQPTLVVLNNLEADHLNYYDSLEHIQDTVAAALADNPRLEHVVVNRDDPGSRALLGRIAVPTTTFGRQPGADVEARDIELRAMGSTFELWVRGEARGRVEVALPGLYNLDNALAAIAAGLHLGVSIEAIQRAYASFHGLENRFTVVEAGERRIIKDYISHPTGIRRVLEAASADGRRLTAVFKPYRFTMIHYLQEDYAEAFHDASETVITELYTAGELAIPGIDTEYLCEKIRSRGPKVTYIQDMDDIVGYLHAEVRPGEQVVFFGGDDLFRLADRYADELRARAVQA
ncbi:MAG: UDP-N-acetylmuramate--L-alanine ligase [Deltaproteobacteria bacterium]|nr:UDP-N-acetylmuramate--L-alanine ligase [Deltaproteobacteria bacterium]